jgi:hypothetical protein
LRRSRGIAHVLVEEDAVARARDELRRARIDLADEREVMVIDILDRPGSIGELARALAHANVNVDLAYTTFGGVKIVIATDDVDSARRVLE